MRPNQEGRLLRLTLNRPDKRNALDSATCHEIVDAVESAQEEASIGAILIDAEGLMFCSGMDLDESLLPDAAERNRIHERLFTMAGWSLKPIVASVQGAAIAGGVGLVANAHIVFAADDASFGLPEVKIGMWPFIIWQSIVKSLGERHALELSLTGRKFTAQQASQMGLVHYLTSPMMLASNAYELASNLSEASPEALRRGMTLFQETRKQPPDQAMQIAAFLRKEQFASPDYREGVKAMREKRSPKYPSLA